MLNPVELDPEVDDVAPSGNIVTDYDEQHYVTYLRLLDANRDGADWREVARIVLHRDPVTGEPRSRHCWETHLARAQWLSKAGYRRILEQAVTSATQGRGTSSLR
ncbi:DNA -binding domain-containing protein [Bradyrhizobium sp.]|uniref:DNA -binding domain-containing protein n=1 Tax=Bradyrhizobium sp. TaxID=376 RepID=UPI0039E35B85